MRNHPSKNPMNYTHDIGHHLYHTPLNMFSDKWGGVSFLMKFFPKGRKRERLNKADSFRRNFQNKLWHVIEWDFKDVIQTQMTDAIYDEGKNERTRTIII